MRFLCKDQVDVTKWHAKPRSPYCWKHKIIYCKQHHRTVEMAKDFLAGIFFFLFSAFGVSRLYWGHFEFPDFFLPLSPSVPSLSFFKGGFFVQKLKYLSRASCVAWRGRGEGNWGGGCIFLWFLKLKLPKLSLI